MHNFAQNDKKGEQMKKSCFILLFLMMMLLFAGCNSKPKIFYNSDSVQIVQEDNKTAVIDLVADNEYSFRTVRVKRSESVAEPYTAVDTDTIKIEIIPSGLRVYDKAEKMIFTFQRKSLHKRG